MKKFWESHGFFSFLVRGLLAFRRTARVLAADFAFPPFLPIRRYQAMISARVTTRSAQWRSVLLKSAQLALVSEGI